MNNKMINPAKIRTPAVLRKTMNYLIIWRKKLHTFVTSPKLVHLNIPGFLTKQYLNF